MAGVLHHAHDGQGNASHTPCGKEITVHYGFDVCKLRLFEGCSDSAALNYSLNARFSLKGADFYLTAAGENDNHMIVPLSSALPAGIALALHVQPTKKTSFGTVVSSEDLPVRTHGAPNDKGEQLLSGLPGDVDGNAKPHQPAHVQFGGDDSGTGVQVISRDGSHVISHGGSHYERAHSDRSIAEVEEVVEKTFVAVDRMQRLSTDLANERTLLAWMRTALAIMRTAFAFLAVTGGGVEWVLLLSSRLGMTVMCVVGTTIGIARYTQVKRLTFLPVVPSVRFGRISITWFNVFMFLACILMASSMCSLQLKKL